MTHKAKELIYIDDAGDPGFKAGSSTHFVIVCVIFPNEAEAELAAAIMKSLRVRLGWHERGEFKFNKTRKTVIEQLFRLLENTDFKIYATLVNKTNVSESEYKKSPGAFYNHIVKETIVLCDPNNAWVRIDGHSGRSYMKAAITYFRKAINTDRRKIVDIHFVDSKENTLIQLADLIAGSILRSTKTDKTDSGTYTKLLKKKIKHINII